MSNKWWTNNECTFIFLHIKNSNLEKFVISVQRIRLHNNYFTKQKTENFYHNLYAIKLPFRDLLKEILISKENKYTPIIVSLLWTWNNIVSSFIAFPAVTVFHEEREKLFQLLYIVLFDLIHSFRKQMQKTNSYEQQWDKFGSTNRKWENVIVMSSQFLFF